jgi:hypothetical protein
LLRSIETNTIFGLCDRALIGVMVFTFARVSAACGMNVSYVRCGWCVASHYTPRSVQNPILRETTGIYWVFSGKVETLFVRGVRRGSNGIWFL